MQVYQTKFESLQNELILHLSGIREEGIGYFADKYDVSPEYVRGLHNSLMAEQQNNVIAPMGGSHPLSPKSITSQELDQLVETVHLLICQEGITITTASVKVSRSVCIDYKYLSDAYKRKYATEIKTKTKSKKRTPEEIRTYVTEVQNLIGQGLSKRRAVEQVSKKYNYSVKKLDMYTAIMSYPNDVTRYSPKSIQMWADMKSLISDGASLNFAANLVASHYTVSPATLASRYATMKKFSNIIDLI